MEAADILYNVGMKRALLFLGGLVILLIAAIVAIPFLIDPNQYRPLLEARISEALHRPVTLGTLKLAILQGKVGADDVSIGDDPQFSKSPFLKASSLDAQVDLSALLGSRKLSVTGITVDKPEIVLIQSAKGTWNISSIGAAAENSPTAPAVSAPSGDASKIDLVVHSLKITNGKLTMEERTAAGVTRRELENASLEVTDFSPSAVFPFHFTGHYHTGGDLVLNGKAGPINDKDASLTPAQTHFKLTAFDLGLSELLDPATGIKGIVGAEGDLDWKGTSIDGKGSVRAQKMVLAKGGSPASRDMELDFHSTHDVVNHSGVLHSASVHLGKAVMNVNGNYNLTGKIPTIAVKLAGEKLPMDELTSFLPALDVQLPRGSSLKGGTLTIQATSTGPVDRLVTKGSVDIEGTTLEAFDLGSKMKVLESLAGIKGGANTQFQTIALKLTQDPSGTALEDISVVAPSIGQLGGEGTISPEKALALKMYVDLHTSAGLSSLVGVKGDTGKIPFSVAGTVSDPSIRPDIKGLMKGAAKDTATRVGLGILNNMLSGKKSDKQPDK